MRATTGAALLTLVATLNATVACAQTAGSDNEGVLHKLMRSVGVSSAPASGDSDIDYTERAPLVVPPSRDLPPPVADPATPAANWPAGAPKAVKHAKSKTDVIPDTAVQTPNPQIQKKPWYNPAGWFDKEEYANFSGEPVRQNLTEPPAGYRVPSAGQPYGISPDKKAPKSASAQDFGMAPAIPPSSQPAGH
jgi:hypothetical protein